MILALPHLGGWEWAGFWLAAVHAGTVTVVVEALEPPELFEWFAELRRALGMHVVPLGPTPAPRWSGRCKANHVVCLLCDRDIDGGGVEVEFFGERTTLPGRAGHARAAHRRARPARPPSTSGRDDHPATVRPPVPTEPRGPAARRRRPRHPGLADELEALIRAAPEQWHLLQPNWPSDPGSRRRPSTAG